MSRPYNPARQDHRHLALAAHRQRAQKDAQEVAVGVAETAALSRARGAALVVQLCAQRRPAPLRRLSGLDWLARKGRLTATQKQAGEAYGLAWRRVEGAARSGSSLDMSFGCRDHDVVSAAEARARDMQRLKSYRNRLRGQADLVAACDQICGGEVTPREACSNGVQAARLEGILLVALDLLASEDPGESNRVSRASN